MGKTLKIVTLFFTLCFLSLLAIAYFYKQHPSVKTYIDQSLISSIPYLWDLIIHAEHYKIKIEWILYVLLITMIVGYKTGFLGTSKDQPNAAAKTVNFSLILFILFVVATITVYFWPSNHINLVVMQFDKGPEFFSQAKYVFDVVVIGYLLFFNVMLMSAINKDV
ncbi:hypothetical protein [Candidatus Uabimicrobium amorphum]|uniref:Uncharacterized protein n=2 Tax=Uabimicrobium amorphum TaxID=2596890 RepID=A0A5S9IHL0_UABAM|nr:hypothetical protein UABAM_00291 [Candidatus Uabimicrobium amorphum]